MTKIHKLQKFIILKSFYRYFKIDRKLKFNISPYLFNKILFIKYQYLFSLSN